ncbi:MAG: triose-phosphate isomerase [Candidatus Woesearchaeota archaeon]
MMQLKTPIIIVNFKTYRESTGKNAVKLARICDYVAKTTGKNIAIAVSAPDIFSVKKEVDIPVLAQHVDAKEFGANTGAILPEAVKEAGAFGTLLNHSEKQIPIKTLKQTIDRCKENNLLTVVCAKDDKVSERIATLKPDYVAMEPPELIGGKISVSTAHPDLIKKTVEKMEKYQIKTICGAGIHTKQDVSAAIKLGTVGILVASGVVKHKDPEKELRDLCSVLS